ncbi:hypothetical protein PRIPAC_94682 [Pristionchus pacificus]|uniref:Uncharacterized protein n=1 Tax=Pristionchus pacificus TaxID=54126 RepID=A0A2A6CI99_PRIPA|nr:hypothetical protein PRIPAC_94682 [Pristionchus pacificus]|eukprot:PDM77954.1 hypothetical protein PRIPAC_34821 [Pristionchus pacificus]
MRHATLSNGSQRNIEFTEATGQCARIFPGSRASSNTPAAIFNAMMLDARANCISKCMEVPSIGNELENRMIRGLSA